MDVIKRCPSSITLLDFQNKKQTWLCREIDHHEGLHSSRGVGSTVDRESLSFTISWE